MIFGFSNKVPGFHMHTPEAVFSSLTDDEAGWQRWHKYQLQIPQPEKRVLFSLWEITHRHLQLCRMIVATRWHPWTVPSHTPLTSCTEHNYYFFIATLLLQHQASTASTRFCSCSWSSNWGDADISLTSVTLR